MLPYPVIDPVIFSIGPLQVRWYGLMYVLGFMAAIVLVKLQIKRFGWQELAAKMDNLNLMLIIGVIVGGRLGYVLFYNPLYYLRHPVEILATWNGGMSFHGGCFGALIFGYIYTRRHGLDFWKGVDLYFATAPIGLGLGRIGNFINQELYGRTSDLPWAMVFPAGGNIPRHPSQLYEAFLEGCLLFVLLWSVKDRPWRKPQPALWPHGSILALFLVCYGGARFFVEFFREPDPQLGTIALGMSMGQILSLLMIIGGVLLWIQRRKAISEP